MADGSCQGGRWRGRQCPPGVAADEAEVIAEALETPAAGGEQEVGLLRALKYVSVSEIKTVCS